MIGKFNPAGLESHRVDVGNIVSRDRDRLALGVERGGGGTEE